MKALSIILLSLWIMASSVFASDYNEVTWDDLMPPGWVPELPDLPDEQAFFEGETYGGQLEMLPKTEIAPIVKTLDQQKIKLPGYMIPIKFTDSSVSEFLLVPYVGACIHTPPPPENQIVFVSLKKPMETQDFWAPVWVSGIMKAQMSMTKFATAGYHLTEAVTEVYDY